MAQLSQISERYIMADWPAPANVHAFVTTRRGGVSSGAYSSLNLGGKSGDDIELIKENRRILVGDWKWPNEPFWLRQVHGTTVANVLSTVAAPEADASFSTEAGKPCAVLTADCLPVLFCDLSGSCVAAAHAGWKGLAAGVLEKTIQAMGCKADQLMAWLGPAISQPCFEVGPEVRDAFLETNGEAGDCFVPGSGDRWMANLYQLARQRLEYAGVTRIYGGGYCTFNQSDLFFSYRRDGKASGRMASVIWLEN